MSEPVYIDLWPTGSANAVETQDVLPHIEVYLPQGKSDTPRSAVVVCPGGGYAKRAPHEGAPFAELFAAQGIVGIVCHYRVWPHIYPAPQADAARAMRLVRSKAAEFNIDPEKIAIMGFSAGGHLASSIAVQPDLYHDPDDDLIDKFSARPNRAILCYPVLSMVKEYHHGSAENLLGVNASEVQRRQMSSELQVNADTPPTFLFHTADDASVPVSNSLRFASACIQHGISIELHVYPHGHHGVGLAYDEPTLKGWPLLLLDWLARW